MRIMRKLWRRVYFMLNRRRLERELSEEMEIHHEMMPADRRAHFGNPVRLQEESREAWSGARMLLSTSGQAEDPGSTNMKCPPSLSTTARTTSPARLPPS